MTLRRCEDYDIYLRMSQIHPAANYRQTVAEHRWHGTNMSSNSPEMLRCVQRVMLRCVERVLERARKPEET
jgi:hypothetical protein